MSYSGTRNQKNCKVSLSVLLSYSMGSTIAIIRIAISLDDPNSQSLNYAIKTCPTAIILLQRRMQEENLRKQEESVQKQEAMRRGQ